MKGIQEIKADFERAIAEISAIQGLNTSDRVQIAIAMLHEYGKYNRGEAMSTGRNNNTNTPATDKQKNALSKFGIKFSDNITKSEASGLLDVAIEDSKTRKGR